MRDQPQGYTCFSSTGIVWLKTSGKMRAATPSDPKRNPAKAACLAVVVAAVIVADVGAVVVVVRIVAVVAIPTTTKTLAITMATTNYVDDIDFDDVVVCIARGPGSCPHRRPRPTVDLDAEPVANVIGAVHVQ